MELNFKAYIKPLNEIKELYGFNKEHVFLDNLDTTELGVNIFKREDCIIIQSTGYKDMVGTKIYEDDTIAFGGFLKKVTQKNVAELHRVGLLDISEVVGNINLIT